MTEPDLIVETQQVEVTVVRTPDSRHQVTIFESETGLRSSLQIRRDDGEARFITGQRWERLPLEQMVDHAKAIITVETGGPRPPLAATK